MSRKRNVPKVTVLEVIAPPETGHTRYVDQVVDGNQCSNIYRYFSWPVALFSSYDVVHLHWPEKMLRHRRRWVRGIKQILMQILLLKLRLQNTPVVRTLHNIQPHESGNSREDRLLDKIDRETAWFIRLNPVSIPPVPQRGIATILHADYVEQYEKYPVVPPVSGRVLHFGHLRPYKGIERLLDVYLATERADTSLRFVGEPKDRRLRGKIEQATDVDSRVSARFGFVDDAAFAREIMQAELIALPYENMHNSGALLLALSLGRPVIAPTSDVNRYIAGEVGNDWLHLYEGELGTDELNRAIDRAARTRSIRTQRPSLRGRGAAEAREAHTLLLNDIARAGRKKLLSAAKNPPIAGIARNEGGRHGLS